MIVPLASYRSLLDSWRLWVHRAKFDILLNVNKVPPQQVFISCNFCAKSTSAFMQEKIRNKAKVYTVVYDNHVLLPFLISYLQYCSLQMLGIQNNDASNYQGLRVLHDEVRTLLRIRCLVKSKDFISYSLDNSSYRMPSF